MYNLSPKIKLYATVMIVLGGILFAIGFFMNHSIEEGQLVHMMEAAREKVAKFPTNSSEHTGPQDHVAHLEHAKHQVHNRPWSALQSIAVFAFGLSACAMFFYCIQHAASAGWSIIVTRVMEAIGAYLPWGGAILLIVMLANVTHTAHMFHWMDPEVTNPESPHFDVILYEKSKFLNIPFYVIRNLIYVVGASLLAIKLRQLSKRLDETKSIIDHKRLYNWAVGYIAFFGFASASWAWDWVMTIDPHWYSTLFIWYTMVSTLASAIAVIILISVYLKKKRFLPQFNDNHLHDLAKFLFAFSMLWTYMWFSQFMLYWYANIPEEVNYFFARFQHYRTTFLPMLILNFLIPLAVMVSSSIKRNYTVVCIMSVVVIIGHYVDFFNMIMPGTVGPYWGFGLLEIGSVLFVVGLFLLIVMTKLSKLKLIPTGNPLLKESEIFEYPF